jgi:hypothetical protein
MKKKYMKTTILALLILAVHTVVAQDTTMRINTNNDGRIAARDMQGAAAPAALPSIETFVPQEAASLATGKYGKALYSIKQLRVASGDSAYQVALMESGQTRLEWIGGDGNIVTNIYRVDTGEMANQMNPNNNMTVSDTTMNNMNRDTSMRNMNNMNRDTSMRRDSMNMTRDTSMRNMPVNTGDSTTKRDSMKLNGTSYIEVNYKKKEQCKTGDDLYMVLSKVINPMRLVDDINFIRRRISIHSA